MQSWLTVVEDMMTETNRLSHWIATSVMEKRTVVMTSQIRLKKKYGFSYLFWAAKEMSAKPQRHSLKLQTKNYSVGGTLI